MLSRKTTTLNLRIDPMVKEAARIAAARDHRSIANFIEVLIRRHCAAAGIPVPEQRLMFEDQEHRDG